jgi:hypothetical protein
MNRYTFWWWINKRAGEFRTGLTMDVRGLTSGGGSKRAGEPGAGAGAGALLYTPAEASVRLGGVVTEAWLRRKAGRRETPCTRSMGCLGFSEENLAQLVAQFNSPPKARTSRR